MWVNLLESLAKVQWGQFPLLGSLLKLQHSIPPTQAGTPELRTRWEREREKRRLSLVLVSRYLPKCVVREK